MLCCAKAQCDQISWRLLPRPARGFQVGSYGRGLADWLDALAIVPLADGGAPLTGPIADRAALDGLVNKIRDPGLPRLSLEREGGTVEGA
jgi:hypothetical protein